MRLVPLAAALLGAVLFALLVSWSSLFAVPAALSAIASAIGIWDMLQTRHALRRNYPILANIRFGLEKIRPEIRQYFLESDTDGVPFNRSKRAVAYSAPRDSSTSGRSARSRTSTATVSNGSTTRYHPIQARDTTFALRSAAAIAGSPTICRCSTSRP
jgi:hypothetical protein